MENEMETNLDLISSNDQGTVVVGEGVVLEGKIDNAKDTNISGQYSGSISSDSLHISKGGKLKGDIKTCLLYTSPSPRDVEESRMPSSA